MFKTLKTLLKTAKVTGVKLAIPADRIGLGLGVATYPTDNLSPGQIPMPQHPELERARSRQLSAMQPRMQLLSGNDAVPPAGSAGCDPGSSAGRSASSCASVTKSWHETTRMAVESRTHASAVCRSAVPSRADFPGDNRHDRSGRDCQSLPRFSGNRIAIRETSPAAAIGK
jgi:hypothetical protein